MESNLTKESLFEEKWLLTYESIIKGWLQPVDTDLLDNDQYFKILKTNGITFYDESKNIIPVDFDGEGEYPPDSSGIFYGFDDYE